MQQAVNTFVARPISSKARTRVERRIRNRRITDALILMVILAASAICFSFYWRTNAKLLGAHSRNQELLTRVDALQTQTEKLEREIQQLQHDPKAIEDYVRHHLGFVRLGDVVVGVEKNSPQSNQQRLTER